jgi:ligand-binding sensor domain-containing protein
MFTLWLGDRKINSGWFFSSTLVVLILFPLLLHGQKGKIKFRNYSMEDGLSMSTIVDISQTKDGYIWMATPDKLNRFDGYGFKTFKYESNKPHSLSNNYVTNLLSLDDGTLLIGFHDGSIDRYFPEKGEYKRYQIKETGVGDFEIRGFCSVTPCEILVYTMGNGICKLNICQHSAKWFHTDNSPIASDFVQSMVHYKGSIYFYSTPLGIGLFDSRTDSILSRHYLNNYSVGAMIFNNGVLFAATQGDGLIQLNPSTGEYQGIKIGENSDAFNYLNVLHLDKIGRLWVGSTFDGLARLDKSGRQHLFKKDMFDKFSLVNNTIYKIFEDKNGNIWIGTISGVSVYMPLNQQFEFYKTSPIPGLGLSNRQVYYIYEDSENTIWIGTLEGGINAYDRNTNRFEYYHKGNCKGLETNSIRCIFQDKQKRFWVGTDNKGLYQFIPEKRLFIPSKDSDGNPLTYMPIRTIYETENNGLTELWIGTQEGLLSWMPESRKVQPFFGTGFPAFSNTVVYEVKKMRNDHTLWIASFGEGILWFDVKKRAYTKQYKANDADSFSLNNNNIMCMQAYGKDSVLVGTFGGGINICNIKTGIFTQITESQGIPNDAIYGILLEDDTHRIWMSTNKGLSRLQLLPLRVTNFDNIEQVQSLEFNEGAYLKCSKGYFYFGGIEGLNIFSPSNIQSDTTPPMIHISGMTLFDKHMPPQNGHVFKHKQNFIGFEFVGLNYLSPDKLTYHYMLEGVDEDWVDAGKRRFVQYTSLPHGHYQFKVKAINAEGIESMEYASVSFKIQPPFWRTPWFVICSSLSILLLVWLGIRFRTNQIRKDYQSRLTELEIKSLRSQMNPHFIFNSINSIQYYILNKNPELAYNYLAKFSSLMRKILQNSRVNHIPLSEELSSLELYLALENLRMEGELQYTFELDNILDSGQVYIPSMILQPFVENAILHGLLNKTGPKRLKIRIKKEISYLYCEIEDNGVGRKAAKKLNEGRTHKHISTAIKSTEERLEILNKSIGLSKKMTVSIEDLYDENEDPCGTKVRVYIPYLKHI